mgnify:FL=1
MNPISNFESVNQLMCLYGSLKYTRFKNNKFPTIIAFLMQELAIANDWLALDISLDWILSI